MTIHPATRLQSLHRRSPVAFVVVLVLIASSVVGCDTLGPETEVEAPIFANTAAGAGTLATFDAQGGTQELQMTCSAPISVGEVFKFRAEHSGVSSAEAASLTYTVDFGDGSSPVGMTPSGANGDGVQFSTNYIYGAAGTYTVTLTAAQPEIVDSASCALEVTSAAGDGSTGSKTGGGEDSGDL